MLLNVWEAQALWETKGRVWTGSRLYLFLVAPTLVLMAGIRLFATGDTYFGWTLLIGAIGLEIPFSMLWLPTYTPVRGRIFRTLRLLWLAAVLSLSIYHIKAHGYGM